MKDYRLSEIKEICKKMQVEYGSNSCDMCENLHYDVEQLCCHKFEEGCPCNFNDIEPRNMIELPCKQQYHDSVFGLAWIVLWCNQNGNIDGKNFITEDDADEFLAKLKEVKDDQL